MYPSDIQRERFNECKTYLDIEYFHHQINLLTKDFNLKYYLSLNYIFRVVLINMLRYMNMNAQILVRSADMVVHNLGEK